MRLKMYCSAAVAALCMLAAAPALATTQIADGGFETQAAGTSNYCYFGGPTPGGAACAAGSWSGTAGMLDETSPDWPGLTTTDGSKMGFVQGLSYLETSILANDTGMFQLNWLEGGRPSGCCQGNQTYSLLLNGFSIGGGSTITGQPFTSKSSNMFSLVSGNTYTFRFEGLNAVGDNTSFIDHVNLSGAVPEPASWALMILGFGGVGATIRSRRRQLAFA